MAQPLQQPQHLQGSEPSLGTSQQLLLSLAQQLRQPLLQIARQAELAELLQPASTPGIENIRVSSETALTLIDNYVLSVQAIAQGFDNISEPVSVSAVMYDAAHELAAAAKQYDVIIQLDAPPRLEPVSMHRKSLQAAFVSLGYALIDALAASGRQQVPLKLSAHRCRYGIVAGLYCGDEEITVGAYRRSHLLHGLTRQPLVGMSASSGAGIYVADALLKVMQTSLKVSRHKHEYGLAAILPPINQLQLV